MSTIISQGLESKYLVTAGYMSSQQQGAISSGNIITQGFLSPFYVSQGYPWHVSASPPPVPPPPPYVPPVIPSGNYVTSPYGTNVNNGRGTVLSPGGFRVLVDQRLNVQGQPPTDTLNQKLADPHYYQNRKDS